MGAKEGGLILKLIRELRERGDVSQIVIAHNYLHVLETCDRVCLLQNGRITFDRPTAETSVEELLNARRRGVPRPRRVSRDAGHGGRRRRDGMRPSRPASPSTSTSCSRPRSSTTSSRPASAS